MLPVSLLAGLAVVGVVAVRAGVGLREVLLLLPAGTHLLAFGAIATGLLARGIRFALLARGVGVPLRLRTSIVAQLSGEAAGAMTPMRAGVDPTKIAVASRDSRNPGGTGAVLVGEILAEGIGLVLLTGTLLLLFPALRLPSFGVLAYGLLMLAAAGGMMMIGRLAPARHPPELWRRLRLGSLPWRHARVASRRFRGRAGRLFSMPRPIALGVLSATAVHLGCRLAILPVLAAGTGAPLDLAPLLAWPLLILYATWAVPVPAGGGVVELAFTTALSSTIATADLSGLTLWWRFYTFYLGALAGGLALAAASSSRLVQRTRRPTAAPAGS